MYFCIYWKEFFLVLSLLFLKIPHFHSLRHVNILPFESLLFSTLHYFLSALFADYYLLTAASKPAPKAYSRTTRFDFSREKGTLLGEKSNPAGRSCLTRLFPSVTQTHSLICLLFLYLFFSISIKQQFFLCFHCLFVVVYFFLYYLNVSSSSSLVRQLLLN